jgi:signal transduction histidine kinase/CheY-like chemotaxis protein
MQQFQLLKRLLIFYTLTLVIMLVLYYAMMFLILQEHSKQHSQKVFAALQYEVTQYQAPTNSEIKAILTKPFFQDISYQLILLLPSGQTYIHRYTRPYTSNFSAIAFPNIDNIKINKLNASSAYRLTADELTGIINTESGEQVYVILRHQALDIHWTSYRYWLPLMSAIILFIGALFYILQRRANWEQLLVYTDSIISTAKDIYAPPPFIEEKTTLEFLRLGQALGRISYWLHHKSRRIKTLNNRLERLVDQAPLPMLMIKRRGQIVFFNPRFEQVFTTSFQRDISYSLTDFVTGSDKSTQQDLQKLSAQRVTRTLLVYGLENKQAYQLHITPWFGEHEQIHGFTVLFNNIDKWVNENTSLQLQNQQLQLKIAEFGQLRSIIGHELRTPLSAIIGTLDLIEVETLSKTQQDILTTLTQSSQSMLAMLNDMLDMAKINAGKANIVTESTDIFKLGQHVSDLMVGNARQKELELSYFFAPNCPRYISTDASCLRQILLNLMNNAIKFTASGYVSLLVEALTPEQMTVIDNRLDNQHAWICFSIKDTGIGIAPSEQQQLFSYFNQANAQIKQDFGGTGLGLAISNSFAQLLGGFIKLSSNGVSGSIFSLYLPCLAAIYQPVYHFSSSLTHIHFIAVVRRSLCASYLQRLCKHLQISADIYSSYHTPSTAQLKSQLAKNSPALIPVMLLDYEYYENITASADHADRVLREQESWSHNLNDLLNSSFLPKILLSMKLERSIPATFLDQFDGFLNKPLDINLLLSELMRLTQPTALAPVAPTLILMPPKPNTTLENIDQEGANKADDFEDKVDKNARKAALILVVEDNLTNQMIVCKLLDKLGYQSIVAVDGLQALEKLKAQRQQIALILMDCRMPIMDGWQATDAIRTQGDDIIIVALTASNSTEDRDACYAVGMNDFLSKPINKDKLQAVLQRFIGS